MTPYDRAWDMGSYTEYMWSYDGICQVVRIPDAISKSLISNVALDIECQTVDIGVPRIQMRGRHVKCQCHCALA